MSQSRSEYINWGVPVVLVLSLAAVGLGIYLASSNRGPDNPNMSSAAAEEVRLSPLYEPGDSGDTAAGVSLPELLNGRPIVMNFFSSTCQPCIREMPGLQAVHEDLGDDVQFIGIAYMDAEDRSRDLVEYTGVTYDTYSDQTGDALAFFEAIGLPVTAFIAPNGDIESVHIGRLAPEDIYAEIVHGF